MKKSITEKGAAQPTADGQEAPEQAPRGWARIQESIAGLSGISLLLVEGQQPPALAIANNNSICAALQSSPEHGQLCDPFCGAAHERAIGADTVTHYRCHAGLQCFAMPVELDSQRKLAVIGGRALASSADYRVLAERFRSGDLQSLFSDELFRNVIFADEADLDHAALRVAKAAREFIEEPQSETVDVPTTLKAKSAAAGQSVAPSAEDRRTGAGPRPGLDRRAPFADSIRRFAEQIDAIEPAQICESILTQALELVSAERGSLMLFDEGKNELTMKAARGMAEPVSAVANVRMGEGIAGSVLSEGRALVTTMDQLGRQTIPARRYKTNSFMSYPIAIGQRKIGVLNLTDKIGGESYDTADLSVIELVGPQIALALERAAWQQRANQFQLMSITDPLTDLHNRRYMEARLAEELSRSRRYGYPMSFMMIDIDDFKLYNDRNGHQAGDRALEIVAQCLRAALRKVDVASRYGGEEFSILLPQTDLQEAGVIADRVRRKISETKFPHGDAQPFGSVTVSIGLSSYSAALDSAEAVIRAADRALYHAKSHGKNRAYAYQGSPVTHASGVQ